MLREAVSKFCLDHRRKEQLTAGLSSEPVLSRAELPADEISNI